MSSDIAFTKSSKNRVMLKCSSNLKLFFYLSYNFENKYVLDTICQVFLFRMIIQI